MFSCTPNINSEIQNECTYTFLEIDVMSDFAFFMVMTTRCGPTRFFKNPKIENPCHQINVRHVKNT